FLHGVNPAVGLVTQQDGDGFGGIFPPSAWPAYQVVQESRYLDKSPEIEIAELHLGFYQQQNGLRIPFIPTQESQTPTDAFRFELK
ncbi:MAG: hypothetical protein AAF633_06050, partial [Chloroflexota bacterium]